MSATERNVSGQLHEVTAPISVSRSRASTPDTVGERREAAPSRAATRTITSTPPTPPL